jgi:hypothetical protein
VKSDLQSDLQSYLYANKSRYAGNAIVTQIHDANPFVSVHLFFFSDYVMLSPNTASQY